ncbi:MAG: hypothetical protein DMG65_21500 [Candidatus Angelobacter sp. Gp1-AA117]|nr:MAG: hypothetical protein DMG65_21500 [Candidatus Angelobacter sp. Gp1-AA117]
MFYRRFLRFLVLALLPATLVATPIKPTPKQVLKDVQRPETKFIPARAGWNGPENQTATSVNPLMERFSPEAQRAANRAALLAISTPDVRIWALLAMIIFSLRLLHRKPTRPAKVLPVKQPPAEQPPSYLKAA